MRKIALIAPLILTGYLGAAWLGDSQSQTLYLPGTEPFIEMTGCDYARLQAPVTGALEWRTLETCS